MRHSDASFRRHSAAAKLESDASVHNWQAEPGRLSFAGPIRVGRRELTIRAVLAFRQSIFNWERAMSIFGKIMGAIFGSHASATPAGGGTTATAGAAPGAGPAAAPSSAPVAPPQSVDVAAIVDKAVAAKKEKLEWRTSIVDLMKALDIDSSLAARKELAKELGYTGDTNDSATMNVWLHKQVMSKLAANGGKLPPEIKH
jgi:hypothetical protein